ncbi:LytR/AlgR family response regulator transcription factor [Chitinophaga agri]|uniref:Response regulator transcription factor n=1 Tax=Chitinophaga agri TaxID=2703787 RepID=A0A6B9ZQ49_9BACT|nr:LytTR family DNA-binding domain-containing protein [Chitinophaga agri]QHS62883.1 response regulator transcription factor [Chitinophaga agri]
MNCLIIDDNPIARATLQQLATAVIGLHVVCECSTAIDAYNILQEKQVDLLLLDIEMPDMTGLELTRNLGNKDLIIIFTTAKKDYAAEAFELNVADYLVKPVTPARFLQAIDKAKSLLESRKEEVKLVHDEFIFIRDSNIVKRLKLDDILYAEAMGDYVKFHTRKKDYVIHVTFKATEDRLPASRFMRVNRSYIAAIDKIDTMQDGGLVINGKFIPITETYKKAVIKRINVM